MRTKQKITVLSTTNLKKDMCGQWLVGFFLFEINFFLIFMDHFNILISKIIFYKQKNTLKSINNYTFKY